jgi:hypothetical protein
LVTLAGESQTKRPPESGPVGSCSVASVSHCHRYRRRACAYSDSARRRQYRRLRAGERLQTSEELRREAWELKEMRRDYRLVLIMANTAFETCLQWRVLEEFRLCVGCDAVHVVLHRDTFHRRRWANAVSYRAVKLPPRIGQPWSPRCAQLCFPFSQYWSPQAVEAAVVRTRHRNRTSSLRWHQRSPWTCRPLP